MRYFSGRLGLVLLVFLSIGAAEAQSWQAKLMTGWTSASEREGTLLHHNIHLAASLSRSITPHWRARAMYLLQPPASINFPGEPSVLIHNLSAGMVYEEPDRLSPICLFGGWLVGGVLYDPINSSSATEVQPAVNTVMGFRGHIHPRIGYEVQGLLLMPFFSKRDRLFDADLWLGIGPILTQVAANVGVTYAF